MLRKNRLRLEQQDRLVPASRRGGKVGLITVMVQIVALGAASIWLILAAGKTDAVDNTASIARASSTKPNDSITTDASIIPPDKTDDSVAPNTAPAKETANSNSGPVSGLNPAEFVEADGRIVQQMQDGSTVVTTLDQRLQHAARSVLNPYPVPYAAVVAIEPNTGKVLAFVSKSETEPNAVDLPLRSMAPSASVFTVVTVAALLENAGLGPNDRFCYHGGKRILTRRNIVGDPRRDWKCATLTTGISHSINSMIAKLTYNKLDRATLSERAEAFGYNRQIPFDLPLATSPAMFPADRLELARTAAGFWHTRLSVLHAALIVGAISNGGRLMRPILVDSVIAKDGTPEFQASPLVLGRALQPTTARQLRRMMVATVERGTARTAFRRWPRSWGIEVGGKTGSLATKEPVYTDYSWFVAFAPADRPEIAVAAMVANGELWHIKAPAVVYRVLYTYFRSRATDHRQARR